MHRYLKLLPAVLTLLQNWTRMGQGLQFLLCSGRELLLTSATLEKLCLSIYSTNALKLASVLPYR